MVDDMTKERLLYIDLIKAIGILSVILAHCMMWMPATREVSSFVSAYHVPVFFVLSGMMFYIFPKNIMFKSFLLARAKSLLIPYLFFSVLNSMLKLGYLFVKHQLTRDVFDDEMTALFITGNGTVWFLSTLFLSELVFFVIRKKTFSVLSLVCVLCLISAYLITPFNPLIQVLVRTLVAIALVIIGFLSSSYVFRLKKDRRLLLVGFLAIIWLSVYTIGFEMNVFCNGAFPDYIENVVVMVASSIAIIGFCSVISNNETMVKKVLSYIGKNSLLLMLIHPTVLLVYIYTVMPMMKECNNLVQVMVSLAVYFLVILLSIPFVELVKNKLSFLIGK